MINENKLSQQELDWLGLIRRSEKKSTRSDGYATVVDFCVGSW